MQNIEKEAPEVIESFWKLIHSLDEYSPIGLKTKELILIAVCTTLNATRALGTHVEKGLEKGVTSHEIYSTILYTLPLIGIPKVTIAFKKAKDIIESCPQEKIAV